MLRLQCACSINERRAISTCWDDNNHTTNKQLRQQRTNSAEQTIHDKYQDLSADIYCTKRSIVKKIRQDRWTDDVFVVIIESWCVDQNDHYSYPLYHTSCHSLVGLLLLSLTYSYPRRLFNATTCQPTRRNREQPLQKSARSC